MSDSLCGPNDPQISFEESVIEGDNDSSDDPLDWLIDGGFGHLPESSLDQAPTFHDCLELSSGSIPEDKVNEEVLCYPVLPELASPKVTVQSLFLDDGDDHLP